MRCLDHERVRCTVCGASEGYYRDESVWDHTGQRCWRRKEMTSG